MKAYGLNELREMFLSFFEQKGHLRLPSFSLIPQNDASLLLINSGMAPMKPWFTGEEAPPSKRVCTCQKCIRTGDIENIGKTARHGTYFEMLGNFSFGDYFKQEAISWCWEFLTEVVGIDPDRLYPSVYEEDDEAFAIWNEQIGVAAERIFRFGKADNFWEHGVGPCGPCSEVYVDRGAAFGCGQPDCTVGCECDRYIEVWNNVFTQFYHDGNNNYTELSQKNIDTGMGLERLAVVCQGVDSLFDVDTVMNITKMVSQLTGASYGRSDKMDVSLRVITDHIRSATFMIGDGVLPSNEGRGYVLRRLLRRAARHGKLLGVDQPFLYKVCATVIKENEGAYPYLLEKQDYITRVIKIEEENFAKTIDSGMKILNDLIQTHQQSKETVFRGADAFRLYDTYGFPIDLTIEILQEQGMQVDQQGFNQLMQEQRERARAARAAMGDLAWAGVDLGLDQTPTAFVGYLNLAAEGKILAIVAEDELRSSAAAGVEAAIVLDRTPFYAEMGGQVGDHGRLTTQDGAVFVVTDVQKNKGGKYLHAGRIESGVLSTGGTVIAQVDVQRRLAIMRAHSATHLLHSALIQVLGDHVEQAGSLVEPDRLRFDFTHFSAMTPEEVHQVNRLVSEMILDGCQVEAEEMPIQAARQRGAMALFGEKYGDIVRVVQMGDQSIELCGGTHVDNTAKVGPFHIVSEFSVAAGVRRIEAATGKAVLQEMDDNHQTIVQVAQALKTAPGEIVQKAKQHMGELREMRQAIDRLKDQLLSGDAGRLLLTARELGGLKVVTGTKHEIDPADLRKMGDLMREREPKIVAVWAAVNGEKITFLAVCGKEAIDRGVKAGEIIREVAKIAGGSGGGKPESAMGGGKQREKIAPALAAVEGIVATKLGL